MRVPDFAEDTGLDTINEILPGARRFGSGTGTGAGAETVLVATIAESEVAELEVVAVSFGIIGIETAGVAGLDLEGTFTGVGGIGGGGIGIGVGVGKTICSRACSFFARNISNKFVQKDASAVKVGTRDRDTIANVKNSFFIPLLLYTFKILQECATRRRRRLRIPVPRFAKAEKEKPEQRVVQTEK